MCVFWTRPQVAGRENRCVGEDSWFNSRFIFSCTRGGIALFLARTTFWRGTGRALRTLATSRVQTVTFEGETMPGLVVSKGKERIVFYDLTSVPPVLRTADSSAVAISEGSAWNHASVLNSYNDAELASILEFLRLTLKP